MAQMCNTTVRSCEDRMPDIQILIRQALDQAVAQLQPYGLPASLLDNLSQLAPQVEQPCVVAIVGRVKAGKSSFINALLGEDLAKVGTTETTATINYFVYGQPNAQRPVRCYWRNQQYTDEERPFLDRLQGNDAETLRLADGIDHLEYRLPNAFLQHVTLVDTPGTSAAVDEHQNRTAEFIRLEGQLRARHDQETSALRETADAVIYLIGQVARSTDQDFLREFSQATQGKARALNAIGLIAKVDLLPDLLRARHTLATKVGQQLKNSLNTVLPVSAGLRRALDTLLQDDRALLHRLTGALRQIPPNRLEKLLDSEEFYLKLDCPVPVEERQALLGTMPWSVFTALARLAGDPALDSAQIVAELEQMAGFGPLREALERHFFQRSQFLRGYRILNDAHGLLKTIRFDHLPARRAQETEEQARLERFRCFIQQAHGDPAVGQELLAFLDRQSFRRAAELETVYRRLDREFSRILNELDEYNADFAALQVMERHGARFADAEQDELRALFGLYGLETQRRLPTAHAADVPYVEQRQQHWQQVSLWDRSNERRSVAERARLRYGLILGEL